MSDFYQKVRRDIAKFRPSIKNSTIDNYISNIRKISKELFNGKVPLPKYFKDFESTKDYIENVSLSHNTKRLLLISVIVYIKSSGITECTDKSLLEKYHKLYKEYTDIKEEKYLDNNLTNKEKENWISLKEIKDKIEYYENSIKSSRDSILSKAFPKKVSYFSKVQNYIILCLYTELPPLRKDYIDLKVVEISSNFEEEIKKLDKSLNYILYSSKEGKLVLNNYKTDKFYKAKIIEIPSGLLEKILGFEKLKKQLFKDTELKSGNLLLNNNLEALSSNNLTKKFNSIFYPKKISTTMLRKIYISEKYPVINTYREMLKDSQIMGHSIDMQKKVYSKIIT